MEQVWSAAGGAISVLILLGLAVKYVLVPYLERTLIRPVHDTHRQLSVNKHESDPPTMRDLVDTAIAKVDTLGRMFDGHLDWSQGETDRLWRSNERLEELIERLREGRKQ